MDWVAAFLGLLGVKLVGDKKRYGWLLYASASAINVYVGYNSGVLGMAVAAFFYFFLEMRNWWLHHHKKGHE